MGMPARDLARSVNLSDKHLQAIGTVAVRWAEMENNIEELVWDLTNMRHASALAVTTHINESMLVNIAKSLVDLLVKGPEPGLAAAITAHFDHISGGLYPQRNAMIHSTFGVSHLPGKTQILPIKARGKLKFGPRADFSAEDICALADEIYEANVQLYGYLERIRELIPTWHHIVRQPLARR